MPILDQTQVGMTTYDIRDAIAVHTINEVAPVDGELGVVLALSIQNGKLCQTYSKEVED